LHAAPGFHILGLGANDEFGPQLGERFPELGAQDRLVFGNNRLAGFHCASAHGPHASRVFSVAMVYRRYSGGGTTVVFFRRVARQD
jgi:hypothetical protein